MSTLELHPHRSRALRRTCAFSLLAALAFATIAPAQLTPGSFTTSGTGCVAKDNVIYELFPSGVFDLANTAHEYTQNGTGSYVVTDSTATIIPPSGAETTQNANPQSIYTVPLSFTFGYPASLGATTEVRIASNGHVFFEPEFNFRCCNGVTALAAALVDASPSIAAFNNHLDFRTLGSSANGRLWYQEQFDPVSGNTVFLATWENVGELFVTPPQAHNFQIQLWDDPAGDRVVVAYGSMSTPQDSTFVGWSAGFGQPDLGGIDFSADLPIDGGDGTISLPLSIDSADEPAIGGTTTVDFSEVPASATVGALLIGFPISGGIPLDLIGMETCTLYTDRAIGAIPAALTTPTGSASISVPNERGNVGLAFELQGAIIAPGTTSLGVVTSNAATMTIGEGPETAVGLVAHFEGTNTFISSVRPKPFFNFYNNSTTGEKIRSITVDFAGLAAFDLNGLSRATGEFDSGNSLALGNATCPDNTYRGTDATTGLVYDRTIAAGCDPSARGATTGYIGTNPAVPGPTRVVFSFSDFDVGEEFVFEADTDGPGPGGFGPSSASGLAGAIITIVSDQRTVSGSLTAVDLDTAIVAF